MKNRTRDFLAATGLTLEEFAKLLPAFQAAYAQRYPYDLTSTGQPRERRSGGGVKGVLASDTDKLLFILSQSQTNYWIHRLLPILQHALSDMGHAPERDAGRVAVSPLMLGSAPDFVIDGTERRLQRPQDAC
ncbi:MAG: hypothetical protein EXR62_04730 [Chloroflexi bacterium]|nr:hypothetical protein [Chloroflexota bacterium]